MFAVCVRSMACGKLQLSSKAKFVECTDGSTRTVDHYSSSRGTTGLFSPSLNTFLLRQFRCVTTYSSHVSIFRWWINPYSWFYLGYQRKQNSGCHTLQLFTWGGNVFTQDIFFGFFKIWLFLLVHYINHNNHALKCEVVVCNQKMWIPLQKHYRFQIRFAKPFSITLILVTTSSNKGNVVLCPQCLQLKLRLAWGILNSTQGSFASPRDLVTSAHPSGLITLERAGGSDRRRGSRRGRI